MRCLLIVAGICLAAAQARASVVWRGDFESDNLSQWDGIEGLTSRLTVVSSPLRQGRYALRTELRNGDIASNGNRNELVRLVPIGEGLEEYYAWSTMFDPSYPSESSWQVFTQWHHSGCCGSPPIEFDIHGETLALDSNVRNPMVTLWSTPLVRGVWHDFVFHVVWSSNPDLGLVELWYDGQKVIEAKAWQTLYPGQTNYLKQGLYRDSAIVPTAVLYHDGMTIGTTLADVAPQLLPPPPADGGTPDPVVPPAGGSSPPGLESGAGFQGGGGCSSAGGASGLLIAAFALLKPRRRRS
ncbi:MAG TPA: polysaccharide lyase [Myxococcales bacterium]|nr:polysaccharide lyase [Myxococcales bacterium]